MKKQLIAHIAKQLKSYGYTVYIAKSSEYGFYTDGVRVVSFGGSWSWSVDFSGNYYPTGRNAHENGRSIGMGWKIEGGEELSDISAEQAEQFIKCGAPNWAVRGLPFAYTTPEQYLKTYGGSSGYVEFTEKE